MNYFKKSLLATGGLFLLLNFTLSNAHAHPDNLQGREIANNLISQSYAPRLTWEQIDNISSEENICTSTVIFYYKYGTTFTGDLPDKVVTFTSLNDSSCKKLKDLLSGYLESTTGRSRPKNDFIIFNYPIRFQVGVVAVPPSLTIQITGPAGEVVWESETGNVPTVEAKASQLRSIFVDAVMSNKQIKFYTDNKLDTKLPEIITSDAMKSTDNFLVLQPCAYEFLNMNIPHTNNKPDRAKAQVQIFTMNSHMEYPIWESDIGYIYEIEANDNRISAELAQACADRKAVRFFTKNKNMKDPKAGKIEVINN